MFEEIEKIYYFMKKDAISSSTYKISMILMILSTLFGALSTAYLGANVNMQIVLKMYGMSMLTYLIIGMAFNSYIGQSLHLVQKSINAWYLEEILVSPTKITTFIIGNSAWGFVWSTFTVVIYLTIGILGFGITLSIDMLGVVLALVLGIGALVGFSMIGAGILILTKQGDPITWLIGILSTLFGNVFFPPQVLPINLQVISYFLPQYYFFTSIRLMLTGSPIGAVMRELLVLFTMCVVLLSLGFIIYSKCLKIARRKGTLSWF